MVYVSIYHHAYTQISEHCLPLSEKQSFHTMKTLLLVSSLLEPQDFSIHRACELKFSGEAEPVSKLPWMDRPWLIRLQELGKDELVQTARVILGNLGLAMAIYLN